MQPQWNSAPPARSNGSASVEFRDGLVFKRGEPATLELEALKMRLAAEVGKKSGRFSVPEVRGLDLAGGVLVTEYVPRLSDLHQVAAGPPAQREEVFRAAGRALATVHRELQLPAHAIVRLPEYLRSTPEDEVALHGDFCVGNVCWQQAGARIVLLDWATFPLVGSTATVGSRYFDLLWFAWSLFFWTPARQVLKWRPERLMRALTSGYAEVESQFEWQRYVQYRRLMRSLPGEYWRRKHAVAPSAPPAACVQLLGWLRWRWFPRSGRSTAPLGEICKAG